MVAVGMRASVRSVSPPVYPTPVHHHTLLPSTCSQSPSTRLVTAHRPTARTFMNPLARWHSDALMLERRGKHARTQIYTCSQAGIACLWTGSRTLTYVCVTPRTRPASKERKDQSMMLHSLGGSFSLCVLARTNIPSHTKEIPLAPLFDVVCEC